MRYIKVFLLVLLFFVIMMLFVQNQASFSDSVTLTFDTMFGQSFKSMPIPRYALLLMSFALGAVLVLAMLLWDRLSLSSRLGAARRRGNSLQKQLDKANAQIQKLTAEKDKAAADLAAAQEALKEAVAAAKAE
ncbi:MAG: LapA family protein [Mailhella sp.]|nr:LapA family protein [Mailhella sp.]MBQ8664254.1 LapA family protein [Mailhella sp.]